jgi:hypothetical protein
MVFMSGGSRVVQNAESESAGLICDGATRNDNPIDNQTTRALIASTKYATLR